MWTKRSRRRRADRLLSQGQLERAIEIYRKDEAWDGLAEACRRRGDLGAAAEAAEKAGLLEQAAELRERTGDQKAAAALWVRCSHADRAAAALERAGDLDGAAVLYADAGLPARAASALASLGKYSEAARLFEQAGQHRRSAETLEAAGLASEAAEALARAGDLEGAARVCYDHGDAEGAADYYVRAANPLKAADCYMEAGRHREAGELLERAGYGLRAAEAYEHDPELLAVSARMFCTLLRSEQVWQRQVRARVKCLGLAADGGHCAIGCANGEVQWLDKDGELAERHLLEDGACAVCVAILGEHGLAAACDDGVLRLLRRDGSVRWTSELPGKPTGLAVLQPGDGLLCCTEKGHVVSISGEGTRNWDTRLRSIAWDISASSGGERIAVGLADGSCAVLSAGGATERVYAGEDWVHSVSLSTDGSLLALGRGLNQVELLDLGTGAKLWADADPSWVHVVIVADDGSVLSVGDAEAILRSRDGTIILRQPAAERYMGGRFDAGRRSVLLRAVKGGLEKVSFESCRARAAVNFEKAGEFAGAAGLYEEAGDHDRATDLFQRAGDMVGAARNTAASGKLMEAAELYWRAGMVTEAGAIYEQQGELETAAKCFIEAGEQERAAVLVEQLERHAEAAGLYRKAERYDEAARLYEAVGDVAQAIEMLELHLRDHPGDAARHLALGLHYQAMERYDTAIEQLQRAASDEDLRKSALLHVAECFVAEDRYDIAINRYMACLGDEEEATTDNLGVFYGLGKAYEMAGRHADAAHAYQSILAVDYQYQDVQDRLQRAAALGGIFGDQQRTVAPGGGPEDQTIVPDRQYQQLSAATKERYALRRKLGEGGMGTVYLAEDTALKRIVALKVLSPERASDDRFRMRMVREAQAVARITHPNVVGVFDVGEEKGRSYISMEFVEGQDARHLLAAKGTLGVAECIDMMVQMTAGLGYAHSKGITHRDIKPENVMVTEDGTVKLMDFGLAIVEGATRLTRAGGIAGTLQYMAPEQVRGEQALTPAVDVYATGCMAYELLTGEPPFTGSMSEVGIKHLNQPPRPLKEVRPDVPDAVAAVVMRCMEKAPADRYADANELSKALREVASSL